MAEDTKQETINTKAPSEGGLTVKAAGGKKYKPGRVLRIWNAEGNPIVVGADGFFVPVTEADKANLAYHAEVGNIEVV